jgi:hypothetical protein
MEYTSKDGEAIYVTGGTQGTLYSVTSTTYDIYLLKIKPSDGSTLFMKYWGLNNIGEDDFGYDLAITPDGGKILVTGMTKSFLPPGVTTSSGTANNVLLYFDSTGELIWVKTYNFGQYYSIYGT